MHFAAGFSALIGLFGILKFDVLSGVNGGKQMKTRILALAAVIVLLGVNFAWSETGFGIQATIPFQLTVGKAVLPAGQYDFIPSDDLKSIRVISLKKGPSAEILVITRIDGEIHTTPNDAHIVFDVVGDTHIFSELWIPALGDGFLVHATPGKHTHKMVTVPK
jgi:hypothetical protein